jgi:hypothetical protein
MTKHSAAHIPENRIVEAPVIEDEAAAATEEKALLPLDQIRVITLRSHKAQYSYKFRRLTLKDWQSYFAGIVHKSLNLAGVRDTVYESESAQLDLVNSTLQSVTGYRDTSKLKNWKQALPLKHRFAIATVLRGVGPSEPDLDPDQLSDLVEVKLDGAWSDDGTGKTSFFSGLLHRFRTPSIEQLRKFNFETARVRVEGTSTEGVTIYPSRHLVAMKIYDELIDSVEGYSVGGSPLDGIEQIKLEMDGAHKAEAALALFSQGNAVSVL